jgi:phage terminase large subunit-like protein
VTAYARAVIAGEIVCNKKVISACERHVKDLKRKDIYFDAAEAARVFAITPYFKHIKGEWANKPFILEPWQQFILGSVFGWKNKATRKRRFKTVFIFVPRKNGKTALASFPAIFGLYFDEEGGAEIYSVATKYKQASGVFDNVKIMLRRSVLNKKLNFSKDRVADLKTASYMEVLSSDYDTMDGLNPHILIMDEVHAWPKKELFYVLDEARGARRQSMTFAITTAGTYNPNGICQELYDYASQILEGNHQDDSFFAYMAEMDESDDWTDRAVWQKVNPNMGIGKSWEQTELEFLQAVRSPTRKNAFLTKHLNKWVNSSEAWIDLDDWKACGKLDARSQAEIEESLLGRRCYAGWDMSKSQDLTAFVLVFPPEDDPENYWRILSRCWCPEDQIEDKSSMEAPYRVWEREGFIQTTPGNVIDADFILEEIRHLKTLYDIREIAYDPAYCSNEAIRLQNEGFPMHHFYQSNKNYNEPMIKANDFLKMRILSHGNHPVANWQAVNVVANVDSKGHVRPEKQKYSKKIDFFSAFYMGLHRALMNLTPDVSTSILWL